MSLKNIGKIINAGTDINKLYKVVSDIGDIDRAASALNSVKGLSSDLKVGALTGSSLENVSAASAKAALGITNLGNVTATATNKAAGFKNVFTGIGNSLKNFVVAHPAAVAISAVVGGLAIVSATVEDAQEKMDKAMASQAAYETTKGELDALNSELETTGNRIDELRVKGYLTITEEAELGKLQAQNAELEKQAVLKEKIAGKQSEQSAREAKQALDARSNIDANAGNYDGIGGWLYDKGVWLGDKIGLDTDNSVPNLLSGQYKYSDGKDSYEILSDKIDQLHDAEDELKRLESKVNPSANSAVQAQLNSAIEKQHDKVNNLGSVVEEQYSQMSVAAKSFYNEDGSYIAQYEKDAKRYESVTKKYLGNADGPRKTESAINTLLSKEKFAGVKDKLMEAGKYGSDALTKLINSTPELTSALNEAGVSIEDFHKQVMATVSPSEYNFEEVKRQLTDAYGDDEANRKSSFNDFLNGKSHEDIEIFYNYVNKNGIILEDLEPKDLEYTFEIALNGGDDVQSTIESMTQRIETAKEKAESLQGVYQNSASAVGMSVGDVKTFIGVYDDLIANNYATDNMVLGAIERTTSGLKIDRDKMSQLNQLQETFTKSKLTNGVNDAAKALENFANSEDGLKLKDTNFDAYTRQVEKLKEELETAKNLKSEYAGMTSAFNKWQVAQSNGEDGDKYSSISSAKDSITEVAKAGKTGTEDFKTYVDYLWSGSTASYSAKEIADVYETLSSLTSDWFVQEDSENNVTALDAEQRSIKNFAKSVNNDLNPALEKYAGRSSLSSIDTDMKKAVLDVRDFADAWGISADVVEDLGGLMKDWGYNVEIAGVENNTSGMQEMADAATAAQERLAQMGVAASSAFNWDTNDIGSLNTQIGEANVLLQNLARNEDGSINVDAEGAKEAITILETLIRKREELANNNNVLLNVKTENEGANTLQDFMSKKNAYDTDYQLKTNAGVDVNIEASEASAKSAFDNIKSQLKSAFESEEISTDLKAKFNFDDMSMDSLEQLVQSLTPEEQQEIALAFGVDTSELDLALGKRDELVGASQTVNIEAAVSGEGDVVSLKNTLAELPSSTDTNVNMSVQNEGELQSAVGALEQIPADVSANVAINVPEGQAAQVQSMVDQLNAGRGEDYQINATINTTVGEAPESINVTGNLTDITGTDNKTVNVNAKINSSEVDGYTPQDKEATVKFNKESSIPDGYKPTDKYAFVNYYLGATPSYNPSNLNRTVTYTVQTNGTLPRASGTLLSPARANGTAYNVNNYKNAFANGKVALQKDEDALINELGTESIIRDGKWMLVPGGMHTQALKKGDIVLSADQTSDLLASGKAVGHGKSYANGSMPAFSNGTVQSVMSAYASGSGDDKPESIDMIERLLDKLERSLKKLTESIDDEFTFYQQRKDLIGQSIDVIKSQLGTYQNSYDNYINKANSVGLSEDYASQVRNGSLDIVEITDEDLKEKISDYEKWHDKALSVSDAIEDLNDQLKELKTQKLDNITDSTKNITDFHQSIVDMHEAAQEYYESKGEKPDEWLYQWDIDQFNEQRKFLSGEWLNLQAELNTLVDDGTIVKFSDKWLEYESRIKEIQQEIYEANTNIAEMQDKILELRWSYFDDAITKVDNLRDALSGVNSLIDDTMAFVGGTASLSGLGYAKIGLLQNDLIQAKQAIANYGKAMDDLNSLYEKGYYSESQYNEKLNELQKSQLDYANDLKGTKDAILDLIRDGISRETDAYRELTESRVDALKRKKEYYDYDKKIKSKNKDINAIKAQIAALTGDDTDSSIAQKRKLEAKLKGLEDELSETQRDHRDDMLEQSYDDNLDEFEKKQEDYLDKLNSDLGAQNDAIQNILGNTLNNSSAVFEQLNSLASEYGINLSGNIVDSWKSATSALEAYKQAIGKVDSNTSVSDGTILGEESGVLNGKSGWNTINGKSYYMSSDGKLLTDQWIKDGGKEYYVDGAGIRAEGTPVINGKKYITDKTGAKISGWTSFAGMTLYADPTKNGVVATGITEIGGKKYLFDKNGVLQEGNGTPMVDGKKYWISNGQVKTGWMNLGNWRMYFDPSTGAAAIGDVTIDGTKHGFDKNGIMQYKKGTKHAKPGRALTDENGAGTEFYIDGKGWFHTFKGGEMVFNETMKNNLWNFAKSPENYQRNMAMGSQLQNINNVPTAIEFNNGPLLNVETLNEADISQTKQFADALYKEFTNRIYKDMKNNGFKIKF